MSNEAITTPLATIGQHEGRTVTLRGWLYNLPASGKLLFPIFRDGNGTIQGIVSKAAVPEEVFNTLKESGPRVAKYIATLPPTLPASSK